jgi:hypothetical protein
VAFQEMLLAVRIFKLFGIYFTLWYFH